jgi:hypothetical protein
MSGSAQLFRTIPFQVASQRVLPALDGQVLKGLAGRPGAAHQHGVVHQYV